MNRRNFIKSMIVLGAAPAIVKAENIMKIWTSPEKNIMTLADWAYQSQPIYDDVIDSLSKASDILRDMPFDTPNRLVNQNGKSIWRVDWGQDISEEIKNSSDFEGFGTRYDDDSPMFSGLIK